MTAIFTGLGAGFTRSSASVLGSFGLLGSAATGRGGDNVMVNAATGNLVINRQDEFLTGRGPDLGISRTYNSLAEVSDRDNGDQWQMGTVRRVFGLTGALNAAGSTVRWQGADGSVVTYTWDAGKSAYVTTDGDGAHDKLVKSGATWIRTDGSSQVTETYEASVGDATVFRIKEHKHATGYALSFSYLAGTDKLDRVTTHNHGTANTTTGTPEQSYVQYIWSGNNIAQIVTGYTDYGDNATEADNLNKTLTRTRYAYDASNRLTTVTVDLSPENNSIADGKTYVTTYTYDGISKRVASITQTGGSSLAIGYDSSGRVTTLTETVATGDTRVTTLAYAASYTTITGPDGQVTRLDYDGGNLVDASVATWTAAGVTREAGSAIGGEAATLLTSAVGAASSYVARSIGAIAAGSTVRFAVSLQAVAGSATTQGLGLYGATNGWGTGGVSARIVSGPGTLTTSTTGFWKVSGLSTTEETRIEITRTYAQSEASAGAYVYVDHPAYGDGQQLLVADAAVTMDPAVTNWSAAAVDQTATTIAGGAPATMLTGTASAAQSYVLHSIGTVAAGSTARFTVSLQAVAGSATEQSLGLHGLTSSYGTGGVSARIVSGPGTLVTSTTGLWRVTGLSTTAATRIEITRTYTQSEVARAAIYVDYPGGYRDGQQLIHADARVAVDGETRRLTKITAPPAYTGATAQTLQFGYDAVGNVTSVTDGAGEVTSYTYDAWGNQLTSTDPNGNLVTRAYGTKNELLSETRTGSDASGAAVSHTTRYVYDGYNRLRYVVSAEGRVTEYRPFYDQPAWIIDYPEHSYAIGADVLTEATMNTWRDGLADRSSTKMRNDVYDSRGNLYYFVNYGYATAAGGASTAESYSRTYYAYDQAGRLLSRYNQGENAEAFVYDGLGRLTASTDLAGGMTTLVFNDAALTTTITTGTGSTSVNTYNKAGDLVGETHSGSYDVSGSSSYLYDKNGRLRVATDATGHKSYYLYDKAGRKIADVNHYGDITEYRYDAAGRVAASVRYTNTVDVTAFDTPGEVVEMAVIRPTAHSYDVWSWSIYDDAGRLIESIDGDGGVAVFSYDASDRLVKTVSYYNKLSAAQLTTFKTTLPTALVLPTANTAKDAVSRTFYDRDGRLIGSLDGEGYLTEILYDKAGQKVEEVAYATITSAGYWAAGTFNQLRSTAAPTSTANRRMRYVHDGQGLLRYTVDNTGHASSYAYNAAGKVTTTIAHAASISTTDFTYDSVKALVAAIASDANDRESYSVYNTKGQVAYSIDAGGQVAGFTYDVAGRVTKTVQYAVLRATPSLPTVATMDGWAATQASNAANRVTRRCYTAGGDLRFSVDGEGYVRRYDYDAEGRLTREVTWANVVAATDATTIAQINTLASGAGTWTDVKYTYDVAGYRDSVYDGEGNRTVFWHLGNGSPSSDNYAYGTVDFSKTVYGNDGAGRIKTEYHAYQEAEQAIVQYTFDGLGNRASVIDANSKTTTYEYDQRGLVTKVTDAAGGIATYEFNAFGEVVKATDARGNSTYSYYDSRGRVTKVRDAESYVTETKYTDFGEVKSVTRYYNKTASAVATPPVVTLDAANDATTSFLYDKLGRVTQITDALGFTETFTYNALGDRITAKNKLGGTTTYTYDRRGLLKTEVLPMSSVNDAGTTLAATVTNSFEYDSRGNRTKETRAVGLPEQAVTQYVYDKASRLIETIGQTFHTSLTPRTYFAYDARGNVTRKTAPDSARTVYFYDDLDRVSAEINAAGTYTAYTYDPNGNVLAIKVYETAVAVPADGGSEEEKPAAPAGNYRETTFTYDNLGRMLTSSVLGVTTGSYSGSSWVSSSAALTTTYQYDANGNVVKTIDPNGNATFAYYDALGRKTDQVDALGFRTRWTYDVEGNVTQERRYWTAGAIPANPPAAAPALPAAHAGDRITDYTYDKLGNRLSETRLGVLVHNGSGSTSTVSAQISYLYNGLGQVTRLTEATGDHVNYTYDTAGRLTQEAKAAFTDHTGAAVTPTTEYRYDGLGNLTRTRQLGNAAAAERITTYGYEGGKLRWMKDPEYNDGTTTDGKLTYYWYDLAGNLQYEYYARRDSSAALAGNNDLEGIFRVYDGLGRVTQQWFTVDPAGTTSWTQVGPATLTAYNAYGEVKSVQVAPSTGSGGALQQNAYDKAGRLTASNAGDGVWKYFAYDRNGNQTAALTSTGANTAGLAFNPASVPTGTAVTYTRYDARNLATHVHEPSRELTAATTANLLTQRSYNAYREVASETNAAGAATTYTYNTMGRMTRSEGPTVSMTLEDGTSRWIKPAEDYYYDKSGRLVATRDANGTYAAGGTSTAGTSKAANSGNLTQLTLLAHTGYGGSQALVTHETHADAGVKQTKYDIHGDARVLIDELGRTIATQVFDQMGRLYQSTSASGLIDTYGYDALGQRLTHWNTVYGSGNVETTDYDIQGRVTSTRAFGGDVTEYSYTWDGSLEAAGTGLVDTGGWIKQTTYRNTLNSGVLIATEKTDIFGRAITRTDLDGRLHNFQYDYAGRMTKTYNSIAGYAEINYSYYNTGLVRGQIGNAPETLYSYDAAGRKTFESVKSYNWQNGQWEFLKQATVAYDALGRIAQYEDLGGPDMPYAKLVYGYDANGNVMSTTSTYSALDKYGNPASQTTTAQWNRYDSMNRMVLANGGLSGGQIVRGTAGGVDFAYNLAGQRMFAQRTQRESTEVMLDDGDTWKTVWKNLENREDYVYGADGMLSEVWIAKDELVEGTVTVIPGTSQLRAGYSYDAMGRLTRQKDYVAGSTTNTVFDKAVTYNAKGQVSFERSYTRIGNDILRADATHGYLDYDGNYALGQVGQVDTIAFKNNTDSQAADTLLRYRYDLYDKATLAQSIYTPNKASPGTLHYNTHQIDSWGYTRQIDIADGRSRAVVLKHDEAGQILSREEDEVSYNRGNPRQITYRFDGRQLGEISNDGTANIDYAASIAERGSAPPTSPGPFRGGSLDASPHTDFNQHHDAINSYQQSSSARSSYTVQGGETLPAIAAQVWGDASLWYKIAEVNGLAAGAALRAGQTLALPAGVVRSHNNAGTFNAYDPGKALGDISPTTPKPAKGNKCGVLGQVLLAVVAIAVTVVLSATPLGPIGAAVAGNAVSQGVGLATGIQEKFSFKGVALAAIGGGVGAGLGKVIADGSILGSNIATDAVRGALGSAITQSAGVATGLQSKFSWAGVAAAGVGAGIGGEVARGLDKNAGFFSTQFGNDLASTSAAAIAIAASRSAIEGSSFGDNLIAALPDAIGSTLGRALGGAVQTALSPERAARAQIESIPVRASSPIGESEALFDVWNPFRSLGRIFKGLFGGRSPDVTQEIRRVEKSISKTTDSIYEEAGEIIVTAQNWAARQQANVTDFVIRQGINAVLRLPPVQHYFAIKTAAQAIAPTTNALSQQVGQLREGYIPMSEGMRPYAPFMATVSDVAVGALTYAAQGVLDTPQALADPQRTADGIVAAGRGGLDYLGSHTPGEVAGAAYNGLSSMSPTRLGVTAGGAFSVVVPVPQAGRIGTVGRVAGTAERGAVLGPTGKQYSVAFEAKLDPAVWGRSDKVHFNRANTTLDDALRSDPAFAAQMDALIPGVQNAVARTGGRQNPTGWTWHHGSEPGSMQLVPTAQHTDALFWDAFHPNGVGGYNTWAIPAGAPPRR